MLAPPPRWLTTSGVPTSFRARLAVEAALDELVEEEDALVPGGRGHAEVLHAFLVAIAHVLQGELQVADCLRVEAHTALEVVHCLADCKGRKKEQD